MTTAADAKAAKKAISDSHQHQIRILRILSHPGIESRMFQLNEIVELSGMRDEKEVQRYLYILEGQKLVSPHPAGDFTSKTWHVTREGLKAWRIISKSPVTH